MRYFSFLLAAAALLAAKTSYANAVGPNGHDKVATEFGYVLVAPEDITAAVNEGDAAKLAAKSIFLMQDVSFAIVEEGEPGITWGETKDGFITYTWAFPHGPRRFKQRPAITLLRHEIAHDLFARYLVSTTRYDQYGTDAPDWLDEMASIAFEDTIWRQSRRRDAKEKGILPLSTILRMTHPQFNAPVARVADQEFASGPVASDQTIPFYATVSCFYEFLAERTGQKSIVAELASAFMRKEDLELWLLNRLGYERSREPLEKMNADFQRWIFRDPQFATSD